MGQTMSEEPRERTREDLVQELALKFAERSFSSLEFYTLKTVFRSLADSQGSLQYLKEDTVSRFLELPDILAASPVVFQMVSYIGSFPFLHDAPAVLGLAQVIMVVVIMTERYKKVLAKGASDRTKLLFHSLAVHDRRASEAEAKMVKDRRGGTEEAEDGGKQALGFAVDMGLDEDEGNDDDDDDDLVLAALDSLDVDEAFRHGEAPGVAGAMIPGDNFRRLIELLLLIAPLHPQESLARYTERLAGTELENLRSRSDSILAAFLNVEKSPGIKFRHFKKIVSAYCPHMFNGFNALFEHFLFSKNLDLSRHRGRDPESPTLPPELAAPLLIKTGEILDHSVLSQLSFFIPGSELFRRLRPLYSGNEDGFSMGSFESKVFNWRAPTILLVRGSRISDVPRAGPEAAFAASIPSRRFPHGERGDRVTFGVYLRQPWRHTHRECFGEPDCVLFQLEPLHEVFRASALNRDYVTFTKPPSHQPYLAFGSPHAKPTQSHRRSITLPLGAVSLLVDSSFEFGVFNHDYTSKGGAFRESLTRRFDFQDRFEIESLEVWGCGGDEEAKVQAERWAWEAREAEARRRINLGTGDIEADKALLEMAGLTGGNRSGGSMV